MINTTLINIWSGMIGVQEEVQALGPDRINAARQLFSELASIKNADELRRRLASGENFATTGRVSKSIHQFPPENENLALLIVAESISCAREGRNADGLNLVDWLLLVGQYGSKSNLLKAHGKLLQGLFHQSKNYEGDARTCIQESLQYYGYEPDHLAKGPLSVCLCCLAVMSADSGDFVEAAVLFQSAQKSANEANLKTLDWNNYLQREISESGSQQRVVEELVRASSELGVKKLLGRHGIIGDRTIKILRCRAFRSAADGNAGDAVSAAGVADWVAKTLNKESRVRRDLADTALYVNQYGTAELLLRALLAEIPGDIGVQGKLGHCLFLQGKYQEARGFLQYVVERSPHDSQALRELGVVYNQLNQPILARRYLKAALVRDPSDYLAKRVLEDIEATQVQPAMTFDQKTKTLTISDAILDNPSADMGMMILSTLLKANPENAQEVLQGVARTEGPAYAQRVFELAFPSAPRQKEPSHFDKAQELFRTKQLPEALSEYRLAIKDDRDHALAYMGAGDCYYHMGMLNLATAYFEESIAIEPSPATLTFLGNAHRKSGRIDEAIQSYEQALKLNPNYELARQHLSAMGRR